MVGSIDPRCETARGTHWPKKVAWLFGARVAETIWATGPKSPHQQAGHMDASDSFIPSKDRIRDHCVPGVQTSALPIFPSGRHFAAWLGLTPKDHSTAGKTRLGKITRAGDEVLRSLLVAGATAVIQQVRRGRGRPSPWLVALLKRQPPKLAAVALANTLARIAWKLMTTGESYDGARMPGASALAA